MKQFSLFITMLMLGLLGLQNASLAQQHDHQEKKQQIKAVQSQEQTKEVYSCPMHPDVVSNKPGNCPKCGMKLEKKEQPIEDPTKKTSDMMGKPTAEQAVDGLRVQFWLIPQDEHKKMMEGQMKTEKHDMGEMKHEMMHGDKDSAKTDHKMGDMMQHDMKGIDHSKMGKDMKHDAKEADHSKIAPKAHQPSAEMEAMMAGTHHVMVKAVDEKTEKAISDGPVHVVVTGPSGKSSIVGLAEMMNHFGGGLSLDEKGSYTLNVFLNEGKETKKVTFSYEVK